ncbi:DUF2786 domain-containing protein [Roseibium sp.]|uniref:DUF2786 domain-containing protein n=2 Tax=Roseibium sp. TaxID=1936156 RepID=UPI003265FFE5
MDKALLDKIRKCLALGRSANEHEAAAAIAKARALMDEHGISRSDVDLAEIAEATARASRTVKPPAWEVLLSATVCRALGVSVILDGVGDRVFVGRGPAAEIASYSFAVLYRSLKSARADYIRSALKRCKPGRKRQRADVFCEGWASAVFLKVQALVPELGDDPLVERYLQERYPALVPVGARTASEKGRSTDGDRLQGCMAGEAVDLNAGLKGGAEAPLALS